MCASSLVAEHEFRTGREMKLATAVALMTAVIFTFAIAASGDEFLMRAGESDPAAVGKIHAYKERSGNLAIELDAQHLPPPDQLKPPKAWYIVWIQRPGAPPEALGQLQLDNPDMSASFKTSLPYHNFDIFVTAEDYPLPAAPMGPVALRGRVHTQEGGERQ